jgi:hypothetical protein
MMLKGEFLSTRFDRFTQGSGAAAVTVRLFAFTVASIILLPQTVLSRYMIQRKIRLFYWLFVIIVFIACFILLCPLTSSYSLLISYIYQYGPTAKRIFGLVYGLASYIILGGFFLWAVWKPKNSLQCASVPEAAKP